MTSALRSTLSFISRDCRFALLDDDNLWKEPGVVPGNYTQNICGLNSNSFRFYVFCRGEGSEAHWEYCSIDEIRAAIRVTVGHWAELNMQIERIVERRKGVSSELGPYGASAR
jgi:hypothetical protein